MSNIIYLQAERDKRRPSTLTPETKRLLAAAAKFMMYHETVFDYTLLENDDDECPISQTPSL